MWIRPARLKGKNTPPFMYYCVIRAITPMARTPDFDFSRVKEFTDEANVFMKQFMEESDRGAALVGVAYLNELLTQLFKAKMLLTDKLSRELFQGFGPLALRVSKNQNSLLLGVDWR